MKPKELLWKKSMRVTWFFLEKKTDSERETWRAMPVVSTLIELGIGVFKRSECVRAHVFEVDEEGGRHGDVIPLQFLGVHDVDVNQLSSNEILLHALVNLRNEDPDMEGGYAVRHGSVPIFDLPISSEARQSTIFHNKFDVLAAAFPLLWPYGEGRWDILDRQRKLSFTEYVRWTLQYHDRRFRIHHSYPFLVFGIEQKMKALCSAKLQMHRRDFEYDQISLSTLTAEDLQRAQAEEEAHHNISNEQVKKLRRHVYAVGGRVMGSSNSRAGYRSQIWSTCLSLGPPSLWITINPLDYDDPVAQVFAGENIDMDNFMAIAGPDNIRRGSNIAKDPYAAAKFFSFHHQGDFGDVDGIHGNKGHEVSGSEREGGLGCSFRIFWSCRSSRKRVFAFAHACVVKACS
jgi:Helitron helicase-like domain at N-terminus